jgi:ribosomal protein L11 methyltransferase
MTERWLRVAARSPSAEQAELLTEGLLACGGSAVEEGAGTVSTYVPLSGPAEVAEEHVRRVLRAVLGTDPPQLDFEEVPEQDWLALWRAGLGPRRMGRITVAPTWSEAAETPGEVLIRIDPQMAFGTGEHASTRGVLRLMQQAVRPGDRVLDVGAGSAILAIAAVRLGAASALAVESDPDTVENAGENIARNGVVGQVSFLCELVDDAFLHSRGPAAFDGILANVLSSVLRPLLPAFHAAVGPGGWVILSGILLEEAAMMREAATQAGFSVAAEDSEEQWWSVLLRS